MKGFPAAFWAETLKARRAVAFRLMAAGLLLLPLVDGLFMVILKDPARARAMGLIGVKAQLTAGVADWPTLFNILLQGTAVGGAMLFAMMTAWLFGREFSDHTVKELLALPVPRHAVVAAKFVLLGLWVLGMTAALYLITVSIGWAVNIPGWSPALAWQAWWLLIAIALLTYLLMPFVALFASVGRGYLLPLGWAFLTLALAQIAALLGWGDWFPWAVPALLSGMTGQGAEPIGAQSVLLLLLTSAAGGAATLLWWRNADQTR